MTNDLWLLVGVVGFFVFVFLLNVVNSILPQKRKRPNKRNTDPEP